MAALINQSNKPSTSFGSVGGVFSCCFARPKEAKSPSLTADRNPPVQEPYANYEAPEAKTNKADVTFDKKAEDIGNHEDDKSVIGSNKHLVRTPSTEAAQRMSSNRPGSTSGDIHNPKGIQSMYESWGGQKAPSKENIPLSVEAGKVAEGSFHGEKTEVDSSYGTEFAEEPYSKNSNWDSNTNVDLGSNASLSKAPTISTKIIYDNKTGILSVSFGQVIRAPKKEDGGAVAYQIRAAVLLPKKLRWHSKIHSAPDPTFNEMAIFKNVTEDELAKSAMRIRLYGGDKLRRHHVFSETHVAFSSLNLRQETTYQLPMELRSSRTGLLGSDSDSSDNMSRVTTASKSSKFSLSRGSIRSGKSSVLPSASQLEVAKNFAKSKDSTWPELSVGLSYNSQTGRLLINIIKASKLKIPGSPDEIPKSYVNVTLMSKQGQQIDSVKTEAASGSRTPEFNKQFAFTVPAVQIRELNLYFRVYNKHRVHKPDNLGWFAMGSTSTGKEEDAHWTEMLEAAGKEIIRWHTLNENIA